jgi:SPP1 gp7 family putative phage head morphogenesis protein
MPLPPTRLENSYSRKLKLLVRELRDAFKKQLLSELPQIRAEYEKTALFKDDAITYISRLVGGLRVLTGRLWTMEELEVLSLETGYDLNDLVKRSIDNQWKRVLGVNPIQSDQGLREFLKVRARENATLISNIPTRQAASLESGILSAVARGARVEEIASFVDDRFGDMETNAETIARTETGKLYSDLNQYRMRELGVGKYIWATVGDDRVRPSHRDQDGKTFSWDEPPLVDGEEAHPGQQINCRCVALPVIE